MGKASNKSRVSRREFFQRALQMGALAGTGGLVWSYLLDQQARAAPTALRPPGALSEKRFNAACIKCGQCVRACPYGTLALAATGDDAPIGTPFFVPRQTPCYMCPDIPCLSACPTGALSPGLKDIEQARMGLAVIDTESCLSWQGLRCEICHRECPVKDRAISVEHHPRRTSRHAMFVPMVHSEHCTGCGICEQACPTERAAIRVVQPQLVQGRIGAHYRLGWQADTPITQDFKPSARMEPETTGAALDYLNEERP